MSVLPSVRRCFGIGVGKVLELGRNLFGGRSTEVLQSLRGADRVSTSPACLIFQCSVRPVGVSSVQ